MNTPPHTTTTPDPSLLTTSGIEKAISDTEELFEAKLDSFRERMASADRALIAAALTLETRLTAGDSQLLTHIQAQQLSVATALESLNQLLAEREKAMVIAAVEIKGRLHEMNQFREQNAHERSFFITREGHEGVTKQVLLSVERNREDIAVLRGEMVGKPVYESAVTEWNKWRSSIDRLLSEQAGKGEGVSSTTKAIISAIGVASLLMGILSMVFSFNNRVDISHNTDRVYNAIIPAKVQVTNDEANKVPVKP